MDNERDPVVRAFLNVAFDSLTFARSYSGRGSATYRSMARDYRHIADFLGAVAIWNVSSILYSATRWVSLGAIAGGARWSRRIADAIEVNQPTISRVCKQYVEQGLEAALNRRMPRRPPQRKLSGEHAAHLVALACTPTRKARWSLRLLADKLVELEIVEAVSHGTVGRVLKNRFPGRVRT